MQFVNPSKEIKAAKYIALVTIMKAKSDFSLPRAIRVIELSVPIKLFSGCRVRVIGWILGIIFVTDMIRTK